MCKDIGEDKMTIENKKPNDPDIWNKKPVASDDEITVKVQRMFPNCEKYKPCCADVEGFEVLNNGEIGKQVIKDIKTKKIKPVDKNPFPDDEEW